MSIVISIDPGKNKCGLVLADIDKRVVIDGLVVRKEYVLQVIKNWKEFRNAKEIYIGNGTTSSYWKGCLENILPIIFVDERGTTLLARKRFREINPPGILIKWIPKGLIKPSQPLDAIAALILLEKYLEITLKWEGKINFKIWPEL